MLQPSDVGRALLDEDVGFRVQDLEFTGLRIFSLGASGLRFGVAGLGFQI